MGQLGERGANAKSASFLKVARCLTRCLKGLTLNSYKARLGAENAWGLRPMDSSQPGKGA